MSQGWHINKIGIEWDKVSSALYYKLYRSVSAGSVGNLVLQTTSNAQQSYFDTAVTPDTIYYYRIQSCITNSCSGYSTVESGYASASTSVPVNVATLLANTT
ncbi:MAG: hypothetical protein U9P71_03270 [Campylobacterota bacterium]|nr:hypothetical protein [Campylobacterota bacterium]